MSQIEYFGEERKGFKKYIPHITVFVLFAVIFVALIYTGFYGKIPFTANVVDNVRQSNSSEGIDIKAILDVPEIELEGKFERLQIHGQSGSNIYIDGKRVSSNDFSNNYITLNNFEGDISFDKNNIISLDGKASDVMINRVSVSSDPGEKTKIKINKELSYNSLTIEDEVHIKELSYSTTGTISLGNQKGVFNINNEEVMIDDFYGDIESYNKELTLDGRVSGLNIKGESNIQVA